MIRKGPNLYFSFSFLSFLSPFPFYFLINHVKEIQSTEQSMSSRNLWIQHKFIAKYIPKLASLKGNFIITVLIGLQNIFNYIPQMWLQDEANCYLKNNRVLKFPMHIANKIQENVGFSS